MLLVKRFALISTPTLIVAFVASSASTAIAHTYDKTSPLRSRHHDARSNLGGDLTPVPPTFAITPRTYQLGYGQNYFERTSDAGLAKRGRAYNVRRRGDF